MVAVAELPDAAQQMLGEPTTADVFEGPEKKLDVFFRLSGSHPAGFRHYGHADWSETLTSAACSILNKKSNGDFDAYLLSESSLFVFAHRVILKTCGTTTLLLVLPRLLQMAAAIGATLELVQYGHLRYKFPELQHYPSRSHVEEHAFLTGMFGEVQTLTVGPPDGCCWFMLSVESPAADAVAAVAARAADFAPSPLAAPPASFVSSPLPQSGESGVLEIAMEGLSAESCALFGFERGPDGKGVAGWGSLPDGALARAMSTSCGLADLLVGVDIDDWAFEPHGYSMNGLAGPYYYTVHVTPETDFSYASFETNDPRFRAAELVERVVGCFSPSVVTLTHTSRSKTADLPPYSLPDFDRVAASTPECEWRDLGAASICYMTFRAAEKAHPPVLSSGYSDMSVADDTKSESGYVGKVYCGYDGACTALGDVPTPTASPEEA